MHSHNSQIGRPQKMNKSRKYKKTVDTSASVDLYPVTWNSYVT